MKEILGVQYITSKEASVRFGYSESWFKQRRMNRWPPKFVKIANKGKVLYPLIEIDEWFKKNIILSDE